MRTARKSLMWAFVLLAQILCLHSICLGQATNKGEISGIILDPTSAVVVGAVVKITHLGTGFNREAVAGERGLYAFPLLEPGDYELVVTKEGFKAEKKSPIVVQTDSKVVVNFELKPGTLAETVTVEDMGEVLKPTDVTVTSTVPQWQLKRLPLNDKLLAEFTRLEAGVTPRELTTAESGPNSDSGGFVNGLRQFFSHITLDGGHFDDPTWPGGPLTNTQGISFDAVKEFTIIKGNADATQASAAGYTVNITTRSGTRDFHGDIFEFFRNNILDARNFFDRASTQPLRRNQFGGSLGGPIPIRKDKDFFFANYEGFRRARIQTVIPLVPTDRLLANVPGGPENGYLKEIMTSSYPRPTPGTFDPNALVATATGSANLRMARDMFVIRSDDEISPAHHALFRCSFIDGNTAPGVTIGPGVLGGAIGFDWRVVNALVGLNSVVSPHSINDFRLTFNHVRHNFMAEPTPSELVALGFDSTADSPKGLPFILFAGTGLSAVGPLPFVPKQRYSNVFEFSDIFSVTHGAHKMQVGATIARIRTHWLLGEDTRPSVLFIGFGPPFDSAFFGISTGRFLSQVQNIILQPPTPIRTFRFTQFASFFQDTYQASDSLTLLFGLRYSFDTPITEANGLLSNAYPVNPATGQPIEDGDINNETMKKLVIRTVDQMRLFKFDKNNFAPNFGISWRPGRHGKTVVKAGYSISYGSPFIELVRLVGFNPPFAASTALFGAKFGTHADPQNLSVPPALNVYNPASVNPYVQYWNLTIERELEKNTVLRVSYIGNRGSNLWDTRKPNFGAGFAGQRPNQNFSVINLTETRARSNYNAFRLELNRRFYHGLAVQGTYVFSKSLDDISAAVTTLCPQGFGCLPTDQRNLKANYGLSDFDVRHTAVANFVYELPVGRSQRLLNTTNKLASAIVSGWSISGIISYWDGLPFDVISGIDNNGDGVANDKARVLPGANPELALAVGPGSDRAQFLDPKSRATIFSQTQGTPLPRNFFRGPDIFNIDLAAQKSFAVMEAIGIQLLVETFNLFNHPNLANPVNSLGSPVFGRIVSTSTRSREIQLGLKISF